MSSTPSSSEPDFRAVFESAPGSYLVLAPDLSIVGASDAYLRATMTRREDILGRNIFDVFPDNPQDPEATGVARLRASLERVMLSGRPDTMAVQKYDIRRPEGQGGNFEERYWSPVNSPVWNAEGRLAYIIHRVEDVTEFVRVMTERRQQEELAEEFRGRIVAMEAEIFQRAQHLQCVNDELRSLQGEMEARVAARTAELEQANAHLQSEIQERERTEVALSESEARLRQAQELEAIGRLAGGIAHDFNNLLTVILSYSDERLQGGSISDESKATLEAIQQAGERAAGLTRQLLAFSRQQVLDPAMLDLNSVVAGIQPMLARVLGEDVELGIVLGRDLPHAWADKGQMEQVLMNLVVNARDAMPRGGHMTVETACIVLDDAYSESHLGVPPGRYSMISVSDTGEGMDAATQAHAFEPFFTTKEAGKGTGLGLSTVFGIVRQSGGHVWLYSEVGVGTTFKVYLPAAAGAPVSQPQPARAAAQRGHETILLVEDEAGVRQVVAMILRRAGFEVLVAGGPEEALAIAERSGARIDLMLTDVVMPKMNGRELAERVQAIIPGVRLLFMSGYTDDAILHHGVLDAGVAFIQKPLTIDALTRKVRQVLDAAGQGAQ